MDNDAFESTPVAIAIHADLTVRFSHRTIEEVFLHLLADEQLVQELVGLEVRIRASSTTPTLTIAAKSSGMDFVTALMNALGGGVDR